MADADKGIEGLARYLVAVIKCTDDNEESAKLVESKLRELVNADLDSCLEIVKSQEKEWGEVSIRVNRITKDIVQNIERLRQTKKP